MPSYSLLSPLTCLKGDVVAGASSYLRSLIESHVLKMDNKIEGDWMPDNLVEQTTLPAVDHLLPQDFNVTGKENFIFFISSVWASFCYSKLLWMGQCFLFHFLSNQVVKISLLLLGRDKTPTVCFRAI